MTFVSVAAGLAALINAVLAAFVVYTNPGSALNRVYGIWGGCVAIWNAAAFFKSLPGVQEHQAMIWVGIIQGAVIFLPVTLAHLCQIVLHGKTPRWIYSVYALHIGLFGSLLFTPYYMAGVHEVFGLGWWSKAGPLFKVYLASYIALNAQLLYSLARHAIRATRKRRKQLLALLGSIVVLWLCGTNDMLPIIGRLKIPGTDIDFVPLGNFGAIFYGLAVAYSVLHHQLLDIYHAFSRVAAFLVRFLFVGVINFILFMAVRFFRPGIIESHPTTAAMMTVLVSTVAVSIIFPKVLGPRIGRIGRAILGDRIELPWKVRDFIEEIKWSLDLPSVLDQLHKFLAGTFRLRSFAIVLRGESRREFTVVRAIPHREPFILENIQTDSPIFTDPVIRRDKRIVLTEAPREGDPDPQFSFRQQVQGLHGEVVFPLMVDDQALGFLIIGKKTNRSTISGEEARLLSDIAENISLVVNQISLKNQIMRTQELDLIGRMSQGMAHDLNNLTTPISTLIQLIDEGVPLETLRAELVPVAKRNIITMREYIKESLFFTENLRPDFQPMRLDILVKNIVEDAAATKRKGKTNRFDCKVCGEVYATLDAVLTRRVLANLIANAVDASPEGGLIRVVLSQLKTDRGREWVRIEVIDRGTGIAPEVRKRIFEPYFSTKKTGDAQRGFGLGLAICRKISTLQGGTLTLESEVGLGTTFSLDLPCRQIEQSSGVIPATANDLSRVA
jgi:signal transduction histidine kinase